MPQRGVQPGRECSAGCAWCPSRFAGFPGLRAGAPAGDGPALGPARLAAGSAASLLLPLALALAAAAAVRGPLWQLLAAAGGLALGAAGAGIVRRLRGRRRNGG